MKIQKVWEKDGYVIRPAQKTDAANYFDQNYNPLDKTLAFITIPIGDKASEHGLPK